VPRRAEQMAVLLTLLPFNRNDSFHVVELASGEGRLAHAILRAFPNATVLALDLSESMRQETAKRLSPFGNRAQVGAFDMAAHDWHGQLEGADAVLSSLCVHHLDAAGKQALFAAVGERLSPRGALLIADLVLPARPQARELFASTYDGVVKEQSGDTSLYEQFVRAGWNYYRFPDEGDQPSPLFDQLTWLSKAGFYSGTASGCRQDMRCSAAISRRKESRQESLTRKRSGSHGKRWRITPMILKMNEFSRICREITWCRIRYEMIMITVSLIALRGLPV
jgi:tRNA (cmo5U34)-methyltransferase